MAKGLTIFQSTRRFKFIFSMLDKILKLTCIHMYEVCMSQNILLEIISLKLSHPITQSYV